VKIPIFGYFAKKKGKQPICGMAWHAQIGCQGGHSKCQQDLPMRAYTIAYWLLWRKKSFGTLSLHFAQN